MKKEMNPALLLGALVVIIGIIAAVGYRSLMPTSQPQAPCMVDHTCHVVTPPAMAPGYVGNQLAATPGPGYNRSVVAPPGMGPGSGYNHPVVAPPGYR